MELSTYVKEDIVFLHQSFKNSTELFEFVAKQTTDLSYSKETFAQALIDREATFPTGLKLEGIDVAIPHSDSIHINERFIAVVTLTEPIEFKSMEDMNQTVPVSIAFVLGLQKAEEQLAVLQSVIKVIQDSEKLEKIVEETDIKKVIELLSEH